LKPGDFPSVDSVYLGDLHTQGRFSVLFTDLRDMTRSIARVRYAHRDWAVDLASAQDIANLTNSYDIPSTSNTNDGQLTVTIRSTDGTRLTEDHYDLVERVIRSLGDVHLCRTIEQGPIAQRYRVEFYNTRHASYAFSCLQEFKYEVRHCRFLSSHLS
jgi:hypothetical protein